MRRTATLLCALGLASLAAACDKPNQGTTQQPEVKINALPIDSPFPDAASLMEIAARPRPEPSLMFGRAVANVDTWTMKGAGAESYQVQPYAGEDRNAVIVSELLASDSTGRRLTQGMQCLAEQYGQFMLMHGAEPAVDLVAFMAARCGTLVPRPIVQATQVPVAQAKGPLELEKDRPRLQEALGRMAPGALVGVWKGRDKGTAVEVMVSGQPELELEQPLALAGHASAVELRGTVAWDYDTLVGYATQGAQGFAACTPVDGVVPGVSPSFALRCPLDAAGVPTTIELVAAPEDRLPERRVLRVMVTAGEAAADAYRAPTLPLPADSGQWDEATALNAVNTLRLAAQQPPAVAATGQSKVLGALLPQYLAAAGDPGKAELAEQIALGMMAGREVGADLQQGHVLVTASPRERSLERMIAAELASPYARAQLLDPQATQVAFTTTEDESFGMRRSALASYRVYDQEPDHAAQTAAFLDLLDHRRAAKKLPPVERPGNYYDHEPILEAAKRIREGSQGAGEALDELLRHFAGKANRGFKGLMLFPHSLRGWSPTFEGDLVTVEKLTVIAVVSHVRPEGSWGRPMVVVIYAPQ